MNNWTPEEEEILRKAWLGEENFKRQLIQIPRHGYDAAVWHARVVMGLGPRAHSDRGALAYAWDLIKAELEKAPGTVAELVSRAELSQTVIDRKLRLADPGPDGRAHVIGWRKGSRGGPPAAIYAIGPGENVPRPSAQTLAEKGKLFKVRRRIRKTGAAMKNPFAAALGLVEAPKGNTGRVYIHLTDSKHDEFADELECAA
jgi:hypothetical protein